MAATVLVNGSIVAKRGVFAAFRRYLNEQFKDSPKHRCNEFHQETRGYGDYLYHQDRDMFNEYLWRAMQGRDCPGFDWQRWTAA